VHQGETNMFQENAEDLKVGQTVQCAYGGSKQFKIGKIELVSGGRIELYNIRGKSMHSSGKKVPFIIVKDN
jgi:hypothetical protein